MEAFGSGGGGCIYNNGMNYAEVRFVELSSDSEDSEEAGPIQNASNNTDVLLSVTSRSTRFDLDLSDRAEGGLPLFPDEVAYRTDQTAFNNLMNRINQEFDQGPITNVERFVQYGELLDRARESDFASPMTFILRARPLLPSVLFPGLGVNGGIFSMHDEIAECVFHNLYFAMGIHSEDEGYAAKCMITFINGVTYEGKAEWIRMLKKRSFESNTTVNSHGVRRVLRKLR